MKDDSYNKGIILSGTYQDQLGFLWTISRDENDNVILEGRNRKKVVKADEGMLKYAIRTGILSRSIGKPSSKITRFKWNNELKRLV